MRRLLLAFSLLVLLGAFRCHQDYPCAARSYEFGVAGSFTPGSGELRAGDTLFFESVFSKRLFDSISRAVIDYTGSKQVLGRLSVYRLDTLLHRYMPDSFAVRFVPLEGVLSPVSSTGHLLRYVEGAQDYRGRAGILLTTPGIYAVHATELQSEGLQGQECGAASFRMHVPQSGAGASLFQQAMGRPPAPGEAVPYFIRVR